MKKNTISKTATCLSLGLILCHCAYGPKTEKKSPLNYLSGEHYENGGAAAANVSTGSGNPSPVVIPFLRRKEVATHIRGQVLLAAQPFPIPLKFQKVILMRKNERVAEGMTDSTGSFLIGGNLPNGEYTLLLESNTYGGSSSLEIKSYEANSINIMAERKKP